MLVLSAPPAGTSFHGAARSYSDVYRSNAAVRTVVDWLARNTAVYEPATFLRATTPSGPVWNPVARDRAADLFRAPVPGVSKNEMIRWLVSSTALSGNAYAVVVADIDGAVRSLVPVSSSKVSLEGPAGDEPARYVIQLPNGPRAFPRDDVLHVRLYNPDDPALGVSPLDSLRHMLAEDEAASRDRQRFYANAARPFGWIERPIEAEPMSEEAFIAHRTDFEAVAHGAAEFSVGFLEEGEKFHEGGSISPRDAAFIEGREQVLRAVAAAYGVPHQLVNTASENLSAAARLVESTLAPYIEMLQDAINAQLTPRLYGEAAANGRIEVRLVQPVSLTDRDAVDTVTNAVKAGVVTPNEGRRVFGLPSSPGGNGLYVPTNAILVEPGSPTPELPESA